jgi:hypothetical protein
MASAVRAEPRAAEFAAAAGLLDGFDPPEAGAQWRPGDATLLGIRVEDGARVRESYMRITVGDKMRFDLNGASHAMADHADVMIRPHGAAAPYTLRTDFDLVAVVIDLFDAQGNRTSRTTAMMPEPCLKYGLFEYVDQERVSEPLSGPALDGPENGPRMASPEQVRAMAGWLALMRLPEFMEREAGVDALAKTVIRMPGIASLIANMGVSVAIGLSRGKSEPVAAPAPLTGACYRVPLDVEANGAQATDCTITLVRADPPLGPCNGMVALEARHPDHPDRKLTVRLLAARRGPMSTTVGILHAP